VPKLRYIHSWLLCVSSHAVLQLRWWTSVYWILRNRDMLLQRVALIVQRKNYWRVLQATVAFSGKHSTWQSFTVLSSPISNNQRMLRAARQEFQSKHDLHHVYNELSLNCITVVILKVTISHVITTELFRYWIRHTKELTSRAWWYSWAWYWSKNTSRSRNKKNDDAVSGELLICCPLYWLVIISASSCRRERKDPGRLTWCTTWLIIEVISARTFSWFCEKHVIFISNVRLK